MIALLLTLSAHAQEQTPADSSEATTEEQADAPAEQDQDAAAKRDAAGDDAAEDGPGGTDDDATPVEDTDWAEDGAPKREGVQDNLDDAANAVEEGLEQAADTVQDNVEEQTNAPEEASRTYRQGYDAGKDDATRAPNYALHGLAGAGAGCVLGPCGCVGAPAVEALVLPAVPNGPWRNESLEYQQGYIEGYQRTVQRRRMVYSFVGASVGTAVGFGAGLALGYFTG